MVEWFEDKIYIKMCMKATKLQELWKPEAGDFVYTDNERLNFDKKVSIIAFSNSGGFKINSHIGLQNRKDYFCIFRQDQLQPLVYRQNVSIPGLGCTAKYQNNHQLIKSFLNFLFFEPVNTVMEKLWLAFVMKELYHKIWNGEDWILE